MLAEEAVEPLRERLLLVVQVVVEPEALVQQVHLARLILVAAVAVLVLMVPAWGQMVVQVVPVSSFSNINRQLPLYLFSNPQPNGLLLPEQSALTTSL
jgi:hypothetical protein